MSDEFKALFAKTREKFLKDLDATPIANKAVRLRRLDRMATRTPASILILENHDTKCFATDFLNTPARLLHRSGGMEGGGYRR